MAIFAYAHAGFDGHLVAIEVDIRRGIPGVDIVGLPDGAVRESRERIRVAIRNCGFAFPQDRILVNLSPAGIKKEGAAFDLPIALTILSVSRQVRENSLQAKDVLVLGELKLSGVILPVHGALAAVLSALERGIDRFIVPMANTREAKAAGQGTVFGVCHLKEASHMLELEGSQGDWEAPEEADGEGTYPGGEADYRTNCGNGARFSDVKGQPLLRRALEIGIAGRHNMFLFGPPGSGKTMAAGRLPCIMPPLDRGESLEVTKIHSLAGSLLPGKGLITDRPFRVPHHSASLEGIIGGGSHVKPGEISLAHKGVLFLDEAPEFRKHILQSLREPIETGRVDIVRASGACWYPADFMLVLAANPCPCGNLGRDDAACLCSMHEITLYWKRIGGALLDRIDMRVPVKPATAEDLVTGTTEPDEMPRARIMEAISRQRRRLMDGMFICNGRIPPGRIREVCSLSPEVEGIFFDAVKKLALSSRACHGILKVARTIADLAGHESLEKYDILEAVQYRRFGDAHYFFRNGP